MKRSFLLVLVLIVVTILSACGGTVEEPSEEEKTPVVESYLYNDFTPGEKETLTELFNEVIPFVANNKYYLKVENGVVHFYTEGNTLDEYNKYKTALANAGYVYKEDIEADGSRWSLYEKGSIEVKITFYSLANVDFIDVYVLNKTVDEPTVIPPSGGNSNTHTYTAFTAADKQLFTTYIGEVIPFIANDEYYIEGYYDETGYEYGLNFYTLDNTKAEFDSYRSALVSAGYSLYETYQDDNGDTWYTYIKNNDIVIDVSWYEYEGDYVVDLYIYSSLSKDPDDDGSTGGSSTGGGSTDGYIYTSFTSSELATLNNYFGITIPFIPNNYYYFDDYFDEYGTVGFAPVGNTQAEYENYKTTLLNSGFTYVESYVDDYGDTCYVYEKNGVLVDICAYDSEEGYIIDIWLYFEDDYTGGGSTGGGNTSDVDLITNNGKGLPAGLNGVHEVDFKDATYVKDVTDQGYYIDGCPTTGDVKVLVIPVEFSDRTASSLGYDLTKLNTAFNGLSGTTDYVSVAEYYFTSSYGKLSLEFDVLDSWFRPSNTSTYYQNKTMDYYGDSVAIGDQVILDEALAYLESRMDLSQYDSDNNSVIDAVVLITTLEIGDDDFHWAYRYWNIYTDSDGYYYEYDGVSANDYLWASYAFMFETVDSEGNSSFTDNNALNTYTFIHEFGHVLGSDDYYDTAYVNEPLKGCDIMDSGLGDHNPFTKFNYGWLTSSRLVVADSTVTLTLEDFSKNGDTIIIANNWDDTLGAYQEYYVLMYYRSVGLNGGDAGYFLADGIVMYHVNASLYSEVYDGETYYDIYYNNTDASDSYGTAENLIELVETKQGTIVHTQGMISSSSTLDDQGNKISYVFTVDSLTDDSATITFTKNN